MRIALVLLMAVLVAVSPISAQNNAGVTREQVLAKLDDNARKFRSLDAAIGRRQWDSLGESETLDSGKLYIQTTRNSPRIKLEITEPANKATYALLENGKFQLYESRPNTLLEGQISSDEHLQMLLIGFGVTSDKIQKSYDVGNPVNETVNGEALVSLELQSKQKGSGVPKIRLWLSQKDWTPVRTELTERNKNTWTFSYKEKKLNATIADSVFKLNVPRDAKRSRR